MSLISGRLSSLDVLDRAALLLAAALVPGTVLLALRPDFEGHVNAPHLDLVLDATATVVTLLIALLAWVRYRERAQHVALVQAAAFLVLGVGNLTAIVVAVLSEGQSNEGLVDDGQRQQYVFMAARILAAALLVLGGLVAVGARPALLRGAVASPLFVLGVPVALIGVFVVAIEVDAIVLPPLVMPGAPDAPTTPDVALTAIGMQVQLLGAVLTLGAALVFRRVWRQARVVGDAYLAIALVLACAAQLHAAIFPTFHPVQVSTADALWLAFDVTMLLGIEAEAGVVLATVRKANRELAVLRNAELERATLDERNRLSRELHDGLAQDLWFAKLKAARLAASATDPAIVELGQDLESGIDVALADARQAVMALRVAAGSGDSLGSLLRRYVDDFGDRFAIKVRYEEHPDLPRLAFRTEAEMLRIAHEALTNAIRHADATLIRVCLGLDGGFVTLSVMDNGHGFQVENVATRGFGLRGMRERAELLGGRFDLESSPHDGTRVAVAVPAVSEPSAVPA